jgi:DnaJ-class molecular chaperone
MLKQIIKIMKPIEITNQLFEPEIGFACEICSGSQNGHVLNNFPVCDKCKSAIKGITQQKTSSFIPYQHCPICQGTGQTLADGFISSVFQTCKCCHGNMIIPMYEKILS